MIPSYGPAWLFDGSPIADPFGYGDRAMRFLSALRHPKSRLPDGAAALDRWEERIVRKVYGPRHPDGRRICKVLYLQVSRGARKTAKGAKLCILHTFGPERSPACQVVSAAADRKQARIAFEEALGIVQATPMLAGVAQPQDFKNRLKHPKSGAIYEAISSDAATQFGRTPEFVLVDELWAFKRIDLWHALRTGLAKSAGSLLVITTTAGRGSNTPDFPIYEYAKKVAAGEIDDPSFLPIIFEAPRDCDWQDEEVWHAANPGLALGYPDLEGLRQLAREARERPSDREAFLQFHLGIRSEHSVSPFVDISVYDEGGGEVDLELLAGEPCWLGVDCSSTQDLTAVVAAWRDGEDGFAIAAWFFLPADGLQARADRDGVPYVRWVQEGYIIATPGNAIDYSVVEKKIREIGANFEVKEAAFDRAYGQPVMGPLLADGFPVVTLQQGWITQSPALNVLERAIVSRRLRHGGNPVLRWCFENVVIHTDSAGNRVMHKGKSRGRIDGAAAAWMAVSRAAAVETNRSIYDRPELWGVAPSAPEAAEAAPSSPVVPPRDGFDWEILNNPRDPRWQAEKERYELHLEMNDADA